MTPTGACDLAMSEAAGGVAAALEAVNCVAADVTGTTFGRLFAPGGVLVTVLTIMLTLYVAFFAIQLVTGRSTLGVSTLTPRMLRIGLVLTFVTSWIAYQAVFWNIFVEGPDWLASVLTGDSGSATQTFATKIDVVTLEYLRLAGGIAQHLGGHVDNFLEDRQLGPSVLQTLWRGRVLEKGQQLADLAQLADALGAHTHGHALGRTKEVAEYWHVRAGGVFK